MNGIFISYRQDDAKQAALMLRDELVAVFDAETVFLDKDALQAGSWREQIRAALERSKVVLVVIGPRWLSLVDDRGERRIDRPDDVHRQEIALALSAPGVTVIPVCVDGATMPRPDELGADIRSLTEQQARTISDARAHRALDMQALVVDIERATGREARRTPAEAPRSTTRLFVTAAIISVILLVAAELGLGWRLDAQERSFVVLVVLLLTMGAGWLRGRLARSRK